MLKLFLSTEKARKTPQFNWGAIKNKGATDKRKKLIGSV